MMNSAADAEWFARVTRVDTPTVCNALELVLGGRRATGFTRGTPIASPRPLPAVAGFARTARIRASVPSAEPAEQARTKRLAYYRYVTPGAGLPTIVVIQDLDDTPGIGAFWGEVNTTVHRALGVCAALTNGSVRDLDANAPDFPVVAGSVGPSHAFVHIVDFDVRVEVFELAIAPGDLLHMDRHGAVIVPPHAIADLPRAIDVVTAREAPILAAARAPGFDVDRIAAAMREADDIH